MSAQGKNLLLIGGVEGGGELSTKPHRCIMQALRRGMRVVLVDTWPHLRRNPGAATMCDEVHVVDYEDAEALRTWLGNYSEASEIDYVFAYGEGSDLAAARAAAYLNLPWNSERAVEITRQKNLTRQELAAAGFSQPACERVEDAAMALAFASTYPGPWICKPPDKAGSLGVHLTESLGDLQDAAQALAGTSPDGFIVEQFVPYPIYMIDGVLTGGAAHSIVISDRKALGAPYFMDMGFSMPSQLPSGDQTWIKREVERAVMALGLSHGLFHIEFWWDGSTLVLGEAHARCGGQLVDYLIELAFPSFELFGTVFDDLMGKPATLDPVPSQVAVSQYLAAEPGFVVGVTGWDELASDPRCRHAYLNARPGVIQEPITRLSARSGVVVAAEPSHEASTAAIQSWLDGLSIDVRPADTNSDRA